MAKRYWLFKSEPNAFSFADLLKSPRKTTYWDGVRNYQARNLLRDEVKKGDGVLFYHSRVQPMAAVGTATVSKEAYADPTQFDKKSRYYDEKAKRDDPRWFVVEITADREFKRPVTLGEMRELPKLGEMMLLRKGARLSIQPVTKAEWDVVTRLGMKG